jgi:glutamate--cysteine ligase
MNSDEAITTVDQLYQVFRNAEKPAERWRIGMEAEKFGVCSNGRPLTYEHANSVQKVFKHLQRQGWQPQFERPGGPVIALRRGSSNITLEPGAALELSGSPHPDVHGVVEEMHDHLRELVGVSGTCDLHWLHIGFHPWAKPQQLDWVPKRRYAIMREYLPTRGPRALDMMRRTATVQVNLDYASERDALRKVQVLLRLTPFLQAMTVNSPYKEGKPSPLKSERIDVWLNMDPERSGLIPRLWGNPDAGYQDYVEWALDAGMFLITRDDKTLVNAGQTFRSFLKEGFQGQRANMRDWEAHLSTLFPEVRLKTTIEARGVDALPPHLAPFVPALLTGICYDAQSLDAAYDALEFLDHSSALLLQRRVTVDGLSAACDGGNVQHHALKLIELAEQGLHRRNRKNPDQQDESVHLLALKRLVEQGVTPADQLRERVKRAGGDVRRALLASI